MMIERDKGDKGGLEAVLLQLFKSRLLCLYVIPLRTKFTLLRCTFVHILVDICSFMLEYHKNYSFLLFFCHRVALYVVTLKVILMDSK